MAKLPLMTLKLECCTKRVKLPPNYLQEVTEPNLIVVVNNNKWLVWSHYGYCYGTGCVPLATKRFLLRRLPAPTAKGVPSIEVASPLMYHIWWHH